MSGVDDDIEMETDFLGDSGDTRSTKRWKKQKWAFIVCGTGVLLLVMYLALSTADTAASIVKNGGSSGGSCDEEYGRFNKSEIEEFADELKGFISPSVLAEHLRYMSARPHIAGSERNSLTASHTAAQWRSFGIPSVRIDEYDVLLSWPRAAGKVTLQTPDGQHTEVQTQENVYPVALETDPGVISGSADLKASTPSKRALPRQDVTNPLTFNGYSATGNVTGPLLYVNYGHAEDFERLTREFGLTCTGHIVIMRYGQGFRGDKVENAVRCGAIGVLLYSDSADDGAAHGTQYPDGPFRSNDSVQRGSIWVGNGDPTTPGYPALNYSSTPRLTYEEAQQEPSDDGRLHLAPLPTIPVQPLSSQAAAPLLAAMRGPVAPAEWTGAELEDGSPYHVGGTGDALVRLVVSMVNDQAHIENVIGVIPGTLERSKAVYIGNHRDAWTFGAIDPISGMATLTEIARAFGRLYTEGKWRPRRSIVFCSWDAEEQGLIGSTEFIEEHFQTVYSDAVAYLNMDLVTNGGDYLAVDGAPALAQLAREVAARIAFPSNFTAPPSTTEDSFERPWPKETDKYPHYENLLEFWENRPDPSLLGDHDYPTEPKSILISSGSGSDHAPFLQLVGVPVFEARFADVTDDYPQYHSNHDSYYYVANFVDPGFVQHGIIARFMAELTLRLASDVVLPLNYTETSAHLDSFVAALKTNHASASRVDFSPLSDAIDRFRSAASKLGYLAAAATADHSDGHVLALNNALMQVERSFLDRRELMHVYRHVIYRPDEDNEYASSHLPSLVSALRGTDSVRMQREVVQAAAAVQAATTAMGVVSHAKL
jgi:N-acetylated-alpha-linked acidic dipeptidase